MTLKMETQEELKQRALIELKEGNASIEVSVASLAQQNEKAQAFIKGKINAQELLETVSEETPYKIHEIHEGRFMIGTTKQNLPAAMRINPKRLLDVWENRNVFIDVFPESRYLWEEVEKDIESANCTTCAQKKTTIGILTKIATMDVRNKDLTPLIAITGRPFVLSLLQDKQDTANHSQLEQQQQAEDAIHNRRKPLLTPEERRLPKEEKQKIRRQRMLEKGLENNNAFKKRKERKPLPSLKRSPKNQESSDLSSNGPRPTCLDCALKHISQATILLSESRQGYPAHRWLAVGHLAEASDELIADYPVEANEIRIVRLSIMDGTARIPDVVKIIEKIDALDEQTLTKED